MEQAIQVEREMAEVRSDVSAIREQMHTVFNRLDKQDEMIASVNDLALSVRDLTNGQATMQARLKRIGDDLDEMQRKPARRWDAMVDKFLTAVVAALAAFLLGRLGLS